MLAVNKEKHVESRITDLEIKISYTEDLVEELNRTIFRQQQQIDMLIDNIKELRDQITSGNDIGEARNLRDELPPHY